MQIFTSQNIDKFKRPEIKSFVQCATRDLREYKYMCK